MIFLPFNQGSSNSAKGSAVVFPAPGGAWSTKRLLFRSFSLTSGMTWVMGRVFMLGLYLKFSAKGEMPQAIIDGWGKVWAYFEDPSIDERRAYEIDFEVYTSADEAEIYIGVHYF